MLNKRERNWIEFTDISTTSRKQIDSNNIEGEPRDAYTRHTPVLDRSGELWLPGLGD